MHEPGLILTNLQVERVLDGDTIELSITRKFKIRVRNLDTFEINTDKGKEAKSFLQALLSLRDPPDIAVFIPSNDPDKLLDFHSFDRVVGDIIANGIDVATEMKKAGFDKHESKSQMPNQ